jgi:hypothetical protein
MKAFSFFSSYAEAADYQVDFLTRLAGISSLFLDAFLERLLISENALKYQSSITVC